MTNPNSVPSSQPNLWDNQKQLISELSDLRTGASSTQLIEEKSDEINRNVAALVDSGEADLNTAWALSSGNNPYIDDLGPDSFEASL